MRKIKTIPPAQTFILNKFKESQNCPPTPQQVEEWLIEFAKMHVKEALVQASNKFDAKCNKYAIINSYTLENID